MSRHGDAEGDWISAARAVVGPDCPVAASYDLHGNVTQKIVDQLDIFAAYRTAPHIDVRNHGPRLVHAGADDQDRRKAGGGLAPVPVLMPGERSSTEDEPAKSLYARLPEDDQVPGIWMPTLWWATSGPMNRAAPPALW